MLNYKVDFTYVVSREEKLFTVSLLPDSKGKFPVVIIRSPYVDRYENEEEENITVEYLNEYKTNLNQALRQPVFKGLRDDVVAEDVQL